MIYSLLSSFIAFFSFLPFKGHFIFAYLSYTPFFLKLEKRSVFDFFLLGFTFYLLSLYWLPRTIESYGDTGWTLAVLAYLLLVLFLSLYNILWWFMVKLVRYSLLGTAFAFVLVEFLRTKLFYGFPLLSLSHTQADFPLFLSIASYTGQWGISLLVIFLCALFADILKGRVKFIFFVPLIFLLLLIAYKADNPSIKGKPISVAIIQPSLEENVKWDPHYVSKNTNLVISMIKKACKKGVDLIVTPETTFPFYWGKDKDRTREVMSSLSDCNSYILLGVISYKEVNGTTYFINRAYLYRRGRLLDLYDKNILVPFGEFVPFRKQLYPIYSHIELPSDFIRGKRRTIFYLDSAASFFTAICYEAAFPDYIVLPLRKASFLVNITNDAWFGKTVAPYLHFWASILRSVENNRYMVRVANTGISAVVDYRGRVIKKAPLFKRDIIYSKIFPLHNTTFYAKHSIAFIVFSFVVWLFLVFYSLIMRKVISADLSRTE